MIRNAQRNRGHLSAPGKLTKSGNFPNVHYREITALRQLSWGGEMASVPLGIPNHWSLVNQVTLLLLLAFFIDATITVWRRGDRQRALLVGGSIIFFGV